MNRWWWKIIQPCKPNWKRTFCTILVVGPNNVLEALLLSRKMSTMRGMRTLLLSTSSLARKPSWVRIIYHKNFHISSLFQEFERSIRISKEFTYFLSFPRVWEDFHISQSLRGASGFLYSYSAPFEVVPYTEEPFSHHWWTPHPPRINRPLSNVPPTPH